MVWDEAMCAKMPRTCAALRAPSRFAATLVSAAKFYVLPGGSRLKRHTGQGNLRLLVQPGVIVPKTPVRVTVADETRAWASGEPLILDDSFAHNVTHSGTGLRVTLSLPVWHPDFLPRLGLVY